MTISTATGKPLTKAAKERARAYTISRAADGGFKRRSGSRPRCLSSEPRL